MNLVRISGAGKKCSHRLWPSNRPLSGVYLFPSGVKRLGLSTKNTWSCASTIFAIVCSVVRASTTRGQMHVAICKAGGIQDTAKRSQRLWHFMRSLFLIDFSVLRVGLFCSVLLPALHREEK
jgi:hypothetical protein